MRINVIPEERHTMPGLPGSDFARQVEEQESAVVNAALQKANALVHKEHVRECKEAGVMPRHEKITRNEAVAIARAIVAKSQVDTRQLNLRHATAFQARVVASAVGRGKAPVSSKSGAIVIRMGGAK